MLLNSFRSCMKSLGHYQIFTLHKMGVWVVYSSDIHTLKIRLLSGTSIVNIGGWSESNIYRCFSSVLSLQRKLTYDSLDSSIELSEVYNWERKLHLKLRNNEDWKDRTLHIKYIDKWMFHSCLFCKSIWFC
jgi:hypothetical protein